MTVHLSTYSLGGGTWLTANIVQREFVKRGDDHLLVFTDTLYEDADAYRFGIEAALKMFGRSANWVPAAEDFPSHRVSSDVSMEAYAGNPAWRSYLAELRSHAALAIPELVWLVEGRDPWEVYRDVRFLGNSSADPCSRVLKREPLARWICETCDPSDAVIYWGISTGEAHRFAGFDHGRQRWTGIWPSWASRGWEVRAPLIGRIEGDTSPVLYISNAGLRPPRLYRSGYAHNNCGGNCCKAGIAHWKMRKFVDPEAFAYDAMMEAKTAAFLGQVVSFLEDRAGGERRPLPLHELAARLDAEPSIFANLEMWQPDQRGCGCMSEGWEVA